MLIVIIVSTYTANLAAFLTASRTKTNINSINDLAAQSEIKYGKIIFLNKLRNNILLSDFIN